MSKTTKTRKLPLRLLNSYDLADFVAVCGPFFEHSPWIAEQTWPARPFGSLEQLHQRLTATLATAPIERKVSLICAHPDLVGRLAREGRLTRESTTEQAAAGLTQLTDGEIAAFDHYNAAYRERFGFPFVICARENKKDAILNAMPARLKHTREEEIATAITEIGKIARLRMLDAISED
jgi:2-oxo-4-hydroxy-4-carboxy-5-ureidoimidazoline decarboxylase